jgi:signal transduction histidine kinase
MLPFLISNKELQDFEANLAQVPHSLMAPALAEYAWHVRYRDIKKSLALTQEALDSLVIHPNNSQIAQKIQAQIYLTQAEISIESLEFEQCELSLQQFLLLDQILPDDALYADFHRIKSSAYLSKNDPNSLVQSILDGREIALKHEEMGRVYLLEIVLARFLIQSNYPDIQEQISKTIQKSKRPLFINAYASLPQLSDFPVETQSYIYSFFKDLLAVKTNTSGKAGLACQLLIESFEILEEYGYPQKSILYIANICYSLGMLNDFETALDWIEKGMQLSKAIPNCIASSLFYAQAADLFRKTKNYQAAQECLDKAFIVYEQYHFVRNHAIALRTLGDLQYDQEQYAISLTTYEKFEAICQNNLPPEFALLALKGKAKNHAKLNQFDIAISHIEAANLIAKTHHYLVHEISTFIDAAKIVKLAELAHYNTKRTPLLLLENAYECAKKIDGFFISSELTGLISDEYASIMEFEKALFFAQLSIEAKDREYDQATMNRTITTQIRMQTDRALQDAQQHKLLAEIETQRTKNLQRQSDILHRLSEIGQEICAQLNINALFNLVYQHVQALLYTDHFSILILNSNRTALNMNYGREMGRIIGPMEIVLATAQADCVRCTESLKEVLIKDSQQEIVDQHNQIIVLRTQFLVPLMIANKLLGVMVIKSHEQNAFQENEQQIFRTLCAYTAIALDNANAYQQLKNAQEQLIEKEKFAALGSLVAGIAHELNTPIGNSVLIASTIKEACEDLSHYIRQGKIQRSELLQFIQKVDDGSRLIGNGLEIAANLVNSFKQVAVDSSAEHKRGFSLNGLITDVGAMMRSQMRQGHHHLQSKLDEEIRMNSYPGSLAQILSNLIANSILHGFENMQNREITIRANRSKTLENTVIIEYRDNGKGISADNLKRIFDPFFTTKLGQGGSGLGLSICYNLVTSLLKGTIEVRSEIGAGTCFTLTLPLTIEEPKQKNPMLLEA